MFSFRLDTNELAYFKKQAKNIPGEIYTIQPTEYIEKNMVEALMSFTLAAEQGDIFACGLLATIYLRSIGNIVNWEFDKILFKYMPHDLVKAVNFLKTACDFKLIPGIHPNFVRDIFVECARLLVWCYEDEAELGSIQERELQLKRYREILEVAEAPLIAEGDEYQLRNVFVSTLDGNAALILYEHVELEDQCYDLRHIQDYLFFIFAAVERNDLTTHPYALTSRTAEVYFILESLEGNTLLKRWEDFEVLYRKCKHELNATLDAFGRANYIALVKDIYAYFNTACPFFERYSVEYQMQKDRAFQLAESARENLKRRIKVNLEPKEQVIGFNETLSLWKYKATQTKKDQQGDYDFRKQIGLGSKRE